MVLSRRKRAALRLDQKSVAFELLSLCLFEVRHECKNISVSHNSGNECRF